jgi:starch-binding outer membrane protein, SusD/RagB family
MRLKHLNKTNLIILLTVTMVSCKKIDLTPLDKYTDDNFWTVNANVFNALTTCYQQQISGGFTNSSSAAQAYFYNETMSDNAYCPLDVNVGTPSAIASGNLATFNPQVNRVKYEWGSYYTNIRSCNLLLENIDKNTALGSALVTRMKAEARFLRAHAFFRLTNFFGDVPLTTKVLTPDEAKAIPKTAKADVVKYIIAELDAAAADLPKKQDYAAADNGRVTKGAAKALKARVQLYNSQWADVVTTCEDLMNNQVVNGSYSLQASYPNIFSVNNKYNSEVVYSLGYVPTVRTWGDWSDFGPFYTGPNSTAASNSNNVPTQDLVESYLTLDGKGIFEASSGYDADNAPYANRDPRLAFTVVYDKYLWTNNEGSVTIYIKPGTDPVQPGKNEYSPSTVKTTTGYYWRKYFDPTPPKGTFAYGQDIIIIRWAEVLLMYAEAKSQLGAMNATVWNQTIQPLRARAGFVNPLALNYPGNTTMSMIDQVRNERRSELAFESLRLDDIKRWKIAEVVMNHPVGNEVRGAKFASNNTAFIKTQVRTFDPAKHYLWPIPTESLQTDPKLTQNPGW